MLLLKFTIIIIVIFALNSGIQFFFRKVLHLEKKRISWSYNYVNGLHRKIDWCLRIVFLVLSLIVLSQIFYYDAMPSLLLIVLMIQIGIECSVRMLFEWKASPEPKRAILTGSEGLFFTLLLFFAFQWFHLFA